MAVQNPFFGGRRDNDASASKFMGGNASSSSGSTLPSTAAGSASSVLGGNLSGHKAEESSNPSPTSSYTSTVTSDTTPGTGSKLTVGPNIKLKGVEITDCDTLVVEGTVEATMDSRVIQIAAEGAFRGSAEIDIAEIHGEFEGNLTVPLDGKNGNTLKLVNNFTYMLKNHNKDSNQPLSVIPKYTVNSTLDWTINANWSTQLNATFYGRQEPRTIQTGGAASTGAQLQEVSSYALYGIGAQYKINKSYALNFGITNLADKRLYRESNNSAAGASTYNELGRAYYVSLTGRF